MGVDSPPASHRCKQKQNNVGNIVAHIDSHFSLFLTRVYQPDRFVNGAAPHRQGLNLETRRETGFFFYEVPNGGGVGLSEDLEKKPRQDRKISTFNRITRSIRSRVRVGEKQEELVCDQNSIRESCWRDIMENPAND